MKRWLSPGGVSSPGWKLCAAAEVTWSETDAACLCAGGGAALPAYAVWYAASEEGGASAAQAACAADMVCDSIDVPPALSWSGDNCAEFVAG